MDLRRVDLNLLVALDALLIERSVTRAAARLSIGQSAMSSALGRLRRLFDDQLLERDGRSLSPTPLALSLESNLRELLSQTESLLSAGRSFDPTRDERNFTIMASEIVLLTFLQPLLVTMHEVAPKVRLTVRPALDGFDEALRRGHTDALVIPRGVLGASVPFREEPLFSDRYVCVVDAEHPDVGQSISMEQLTSLPYLAWASGARPSLAERHFDLHGIQRNVELTTSVIAAPFLLQGTRYVTLVPSRLARWALQRAPIRLVELPLELPPLVETLFWTPSAETDAGHRWLRDFLGSAAERHAEA